MDEEYPLSTRMLQRLGGSAPMVEAVRKYGNWLESEAAAEGGIGPDEMPRLDNRHLADSLAVAECWYPHRPTLIADLGSGVGLPGIPLAILYPDAAVTLVDRSRARCRLIRRAVRVLDLPNVRVIEADANQLDETFQVVVARGFLPPDLALGILRRLVLPDGWGLIHGSRVAPRSVPGYSTREVGEGILDPASWILMMDH